MEIELCKKLLELVPCPNPECDSKEHLLEIKNSMKGYNKKQVRCLCGVEGPRGMDEEEAMRLWNLSFGRNK